MTANSSPLARLAFACALAIPTLGALAQSVAPTDASDKISVGALSIVLAPIASVEGSAQSGPSGAAAGSGLVILGGAYLVEGVVQGAGQASVVALRSVSTGAKMSVRVAGSAVSGASLAVGSAIEAVAEASGVILVSAGRVVAFVPNSLGESLMSQSRLPR